ncbi:MAG TPA: cyclic pyranopterin monophosphate synthase MoaC [bacterium]|nr:cyclic pyranopterin monophosphate synthase MoaC [bacterium]
MEFPVLSHLDADGDARMVDVGAKMPTARCAIAACEILMKPETLFLLRSGKIKKGDAFTVAKTAAFLAAKKTSELIPLCHPLALDFIEVRFLDNAEGDGIVIESEVRTTAKTGVEMEALTAASLAALTLYDMAKAVDPGMRISNLRLVKKTGGKSDYHD